MAVNPFRSLLEAGDPATASGYVNHPPRMGFFTDTSVCIGCKACEVACKEWNHVPEDGLQFTAMSYDNTIGLGADTWRHVAFIEQTKRLAHQITGASPRVGDATPAPGGDGGGGGAGGAGDGGIRWLMASDVCKHCTHAACLDVCPTGALFRTEFGTVVVQEDVCNGCGYCIPACPYGVIDQRHGDGRAWKCTLCYDRISVGVEPACAKACPTDSIQFGVLDELHERADTRLAQLHAAGVSDARLYGRDPDDGVGGDGAFFLLLDEPEVYGLPPDPVVTTADLPVMWRRVATAAVLVAATVGASFAREETMNQTDVTTDGEFRSYYGQPVINRPVWGAPDIPGYLFLGGLAGASSVVAALADPTGRPSLARVSKMGAVAAGGLSLVALVHDLGRPARFLNMLRTFKPSSPMSVGSWILAGYGPAATVAAACDLTGLLPGLGTAATAGAAVLGPALATYTAALIADTAVPAWHDAHRELPFVFGASALSSAAGLALAGAPVATTGPMRLLGAVAGAAELASQRVMEHRMGMAAGAYSEGRAKHYRRIARSLVLAGALGAGLGSRRRPVSVVAGAALLAGSALTRFAIFEAGMASAMDPAYTVVPQRRRLDLRGGVPTPANGGAAGRPAERFAEGPAER